MRGEGRGRAFKKKSLKVALQHVHDHVARHMGAGFDLREASPLLTDVRSGPEEAAMIPGRCPAL